MLIPRRAEVLEVAIPMQMTFRHATAARSESDSVVVRITDARGRTGHGECAPRVYVTGESAASVRTSLERMLRGVLGARYTSFDAVVADLAERARALPRAEHAAFCAFELALLDLAGIAFDQSAGTLLGPVLAPEVRYSGVVSGDSVDEVEKACARIRKFGITAVKLKVGRSLAEDVEVLAAARAILGEECALRVDANGAWSKDEADERVATFERFGLHGLEQPVAADDLVGMAALTAASPIPIIADESLVSVEDAAELAARRGCHVFNVRISKCGGLANSARIREIGRAAGIGCMLGAQVGETALLSAAGRQFATRVPDLRFCEGSFGTLLLAEDIAAEDITFGPGGAAPALVGPGLGVAVVEASLRNHVRHDTSVSSP